MQVLRYFENGSAANTLRVGKLVICYVLVVHWIGCFLIFVNESDGQLYEKEIEGMNGSEKFEIYVAKSLDAFHVRNLAVHICI